MSIKKLLKLFLLFFSFTIFDSKANVVPVEYVEHARGLVLKFAQLIYDCFEMNDRAKQDMAPSAGDIKMLKSGKGDRKEVRIAAIKGMEKIFDKDFKHLLAKYSFIDSDEVEEGDFAMQILAIHKDLSDFCKVLGIAPAIKQSKDLIVLLSNLKFTLLEIEAFIKTEKNAPLLKKIFWGSDFSYNILPAIFNVAAPILLIYFAQRGYRNDIKRARDVAAAARNAAPGDATEARTKNDDLRMAADIGSERGNAVAALDERMSWKNRALMTAPLFVPVASLIYQGVQKKEFQKRSVTADRDYAEEWAKKKYSVTQKTTFDDIIGYSKIKEKIKEIINVLRDPIKYIKHDIEVPKGVLLYGPPGCGKTMFARAIATESGCRCVVVAASDLLADKDCSSDEKINRIFWHAELCAPSILFIDEIDFIAQRDKDDGRKTLATLLTKLSGFKLRNPYKPVLVIAATNKFEELDPALIRSGRFDLHLELPNPDAETRKLMIERELETKNDLLFDKSLSMEKLVKRTNGFNFADIVMLCNCARMKAVLKKQKNLTMENFEEAFKQKELKQR